VVLSHIFFLREFLNFLVSKVAVIQLKYEEIFYYNDILSNHNVYKHRISFQIWNICPYDIQIYLFFRLGVCYAFCFLCVVSFLLMRAGWQPAENDFDVLSPSDNYII